MPFSIISNCSNCRNPRTLWLSAVSDNKSNLRVLNAMLENLTVMLMEYYCFGQQLGSSPLWEQHHQAIRSAARLNSGRESAVLKR